MRITSFVIENYIACNMKKGKKKVVVVLGQTASGKSDRAVRLAIKFDGEVISADSRQVYKRLDIGTGKITKKEMRGVPHYMLSVASPDRQFSVAEYIKQARKIIDDMHKREKLPVVCGGTGFYIDALLGHMRLSSIPPYKALREKLEKKTTEELFDELKMQAPLRAKMIDARNRRRLIRALEISLASPYSSFTDIHSGHPSYDYLKIGLVLPDQELKEKISIRLFARIREGMFGEVKNLHKKGLSWKRMDGLGLEYRYISRYLRGNISKEEMKEKLKTEIWRYAKRQKTWFKKDKKIHWFHPSEQKKIEEEVQKFLLEHKKTPI
jgi:tRNA dimethylallyltransferase